MPFLDRAWRRIGLVLVPVLGLVIPARAEVKLPAVISDGMVLQRGRAVPIFGTAPAGEKVTVRFRDHTAAATSDGKWTVMLPPMEPGGPFPLTVHGRNTITFQSVYVGEVWLCSGQSNMEWPVSHSTSGPAAAQRSPNKLLRLFRERDRTPRWRASGPATIGNFSAVAYFFGRDLQAALGVPVGLIETSVGGTAIQPWMSAADLKAMGFGKSPRPGFYGGLHQSLIRPLQPYAIRGVIWYQGESNASDPQAYARLFPRMIAEWRKEWGEGDFPFLFVQLARIGKPGPSVEWAGLREAQRHSLAVPHTAMAVCFDVSDGDIHPRDKEPVGHRLALAALALVYGRKVEYSGPLYQSAERDGSSIRIRFTHAEGLQATGGQPRDFEIGPPHGPFKPATATIQGNQVVVSAGGLSGPVVVRYGWRAYPEGNLYNAAGLPASPFETGPID